MIYLENNCRQNNIRYIDLFCGIGGFRVAAENIFSKAGLASKCVFSSDIDEFARKSYFANFGEIPVGEIKKINPILIPDHDLLFAGLPCQPFSIIGKGKGFKDIRGTLFFDVVKILKAKKPKAFLLENVKHLKGHNRGNTLERILEISRSLGYYVDYRVLNALDFGLPQKRERVFIVGFLEPVMLDWPKGRIKTTTLNELLEKNPDPNYFVSDRIRKKRMSRHNPLKTPSIWHENKSGNISSYPFSCALRAEASHNYLLVDGKRRLTPREMLRLQGFPESFKIVCSHVQMKRQAGNSVPVNIVEDLLKKMLPHLAKKIIRTGSRQKTDF